MFLPALADPVNVIKLTLLVLLALAALFLLLLETVRSRTVTIPTGPAVWVALALLLAFGISVLVAPNTTTAIVGTYGRNSGFMAYAAALVLFLAGTRWWTAATGHWLALALIASGAFTAGYGLLQYAGADPVNWSNPFNPIIGALGNPDFASAYLGMTTPVAAWGALRRGWGLPWRVASAVAGLTCLVVAFLSHAVQGPLAAGAGLVVVVVAVLLERGGPLARRGLLGLGGLTVLGLVTLVAGAAKIGPAARIFRRTSFQARQYYWDGAVDMFRQHPLFGVGLDHYGAHWRQVRSDAATRVLGGDAYSDAAHSVPLQMLAQGGVVLAVAYVAFIITVAAYLVRGLMRTEGDARLLLGGLGGAWTAYLVESTVSIDQVPMLTLEFVTAGAVVALSSAASRQLRLPGALREPVAGATRRGRKVPTVRVRETTPADLAWTSAAALGLLVLAWFSWLPLRANAAVRHGDVALAQGRGNEALTAYQHANTLLAGVGAYWEKTGFLLESVHHDELALPEYRRGIKHDPYDIALLSNGARLADAAKQYAEAGRYWRRAVALDPTNPDTVFRGSRFEAAHGDAQVALRMLAHPLAVFPADPNLWAAAGDGRLAAGNVTGARAAYQKALTLQPLNTAATVGMQKLNGTAPAG
ncbi:MAG: hypothetical protein QOI82_1668 [Actinomycetota bacterium]|nr:hypothetical protein [Actinomycetota bacterium]